MQIPITQDEALEYIINVEGGFVNHKNDKGKATKYGITQKTLSSFIGREAKVEEVKFLTKELAKEIYREYYWNPMMLSEIEGHMIRLSLFDQCVNWGPRAVTKRIQKICNEYFKDRLIVDGKIGPKTISVINCINDEVITQDFLSSSLDAYRSLVDRDESQRVFLAGWIYRISKLDFLFFGET